MLFFYKDENISLQTFNGEVSAGLLAGYISGIRHGSNLLFDLLRLFDEKKMWFYLRFNVVG